MTKQQPLWHRLYFEPLFTELARLIGYDGIAYDQACEKAKPLGERFGKENVQRAVDAIARVDESTKPPKLRLTDEARKLCWQLLGPPPTETQTSPPPPPANPPLDPAAQDRAARCNKRQLACMLRDARRSLEHNGKSSFAGKQAKKEIAAAEAEMKRRGMEIPPTVEEAKRSQSQDAPASEPQPKRKGQCSHEPH